MTGGGFINVGRGKANFGVTGGIKNGALFGHLAFVDHVSGLKVNGTSVTMYTALDAKTRHIEGTAMINGVAGTCKLDVSDNGKSGRSDSFSLKLSTGYNAAGTLGAGNIQLHKRPLQ